MGGISIVTAVIFNPINATVFGAKNELITETARFKNRHDIFVRILILHVLLCLRLRASSECDRKNGCE